MEISKEIIDRRPCYSCKKTLPLQKFEGNRLECKYCRYQKNNKKRIEEGKIDRRKILIDETRKTECNDKCQDCDIDIKDLIKFDHIEQDNKLKTKNGNKIKGIRNLSYDNLEKELQKPHQWLCFNCHKIKTIETTSSVTLGFGRIIINELIKILGNNCELCNESRKITLTFDHIIEQNKEFTIGDKIQQLRLRIDCGVNTIQNIKKIINEICIEVKKCGLLCNNCNWLKNEYKVICESKFKLKKECWTTKEG